jgi:UDP-N-acetylmuramoyl-tripeptide--D-alanyl-D-alanine ligase
MGMNAPGEIARLTEIATPTHGLITCVASAHLQGLGSLDGVAAAKGELFCGLDAEAMAVINTDDERVVRVARGFRGARRVRYGDRAEVRAENVASDSLSGSRFDLVYGSQRASVRVPLAGRHNVGNAVAAAACAYGLGLPLDVVVSGLAGVTVPPMRVGVETLANGVCIVNDAYNANPHSLAAALQTMAEAVPGRRILAIGGMLELGDQAAELHRAAGRAAAALAPVLLCAVGDHAQDLALGASEGGLPQSSIVVAADHERIARAIAAVWRAGDTVLVKGSRGSQMERVVSALREHVAQ